MKLMMSLATATVIMTSALMQPATAGRSSGNSYSIMNGNEDEISAQFNLFATDEDGNTIIDTAPDDNPTDDISPANDNIGLFRGAITDYVLGFGKLRTRERGLLPSDYDSAGNPILAVRFEERTKAFDVGDLLAEKVTDSNNNIYIKYSIFEEYGTTSASSYFILNPRNPARSFTPLPEDIDIDRAVNDLSYILNNNLLDGVNNSSPITRDLGLMPEDPFFIIKQGVIEAQTVPETSNVNAILLILTIFGTSSLFKRKARMSSK